MIDLPAQIEQARSEIDRRGLGNRLSAQAGDFLTAIPDGDLLLLRYVLHNWDDESARRILANCRKALRPGGRVLVLELIVGEMGGPRIGPSQDINMLVRFGVRERTIDEYEALFASAGLTLVSTTPTNSLMSIVEAAAADGTASPGSDDKNSGAPLANG